MWLCTKLGFYSIVKKKDGLHVRSRTVKDLENLLEASKLTDVTLRNWPGADYRYRMIFQHEGMQAAIWMTLMNSVDYENFKSTIANTPDQRGKLGDYGQIWHMGREWQNVDLDGRARRLIATSVDDLKSSLIHCSDIDLLQHAEAITRARGESSKAKMIASRIRQLPKA